MELYTTQNCVYDYQTVAGSLDSYPVVASSTCQTLASPTVANPPSYYDLAFFATIALFLLAFIPMGLIWSPFNKK